MLNTTLILEFLVPALRSGRFKQTDGVLKNKNADGEYRHCCLGVACEIALEENLVRGRWGEYSISFITATGEEERYELPGEVREIYGFDLSEGLLLTMKGKKMSMAGHNDAGRTFDEIADALETYCAGYELARSHLSVPA